MAAMTKEMHRLEKVKDIGESIARLPSACLDDIKTEQEVQRAKSTALHSALDQARGSDYSKLVKEIDDMQNKSKRAYVRLYEKVGEEIGMNFLDKLDYLGSKQSEADRLIGGKYKYSSAQVELSRLKDEKHRIEKMQREKEKEYLRTDLADSTGSGNAH